MNTKQTVKGFTIIEVVLVLAIAGLIFLMVFVALPALQSGQRDTARRGDVGTVAAAVTSYSNTNRGKFPDTAQLETQLGATGSGDTKAYQTVSNNTLTTEVVANGTAQVYTIPEATIRVYKGLKCSTNAAQGSVTLVSGSARQFATVTRLEGGNGSGYCLDS